jgi:hypothetical protein
MRRKFPVFRRTGEFGIQEFTPNVLMLRAIKPRRQAEKGQIRWDFEDSLLNSLLAGNCGRRKQGRCPKSSPHRSSTAQRRMQMKSVQLFLSVSATADFDCAGEHGYDFTASYFNPPLPQRDTPRHHPDRSQSSAVSRSRAAKYGLFGSVPGSGWFFNKVVDVFEEHRADGVDRLMAVEALIHEAEHNLRHGRLVAEGDLVLDDGVHGGVQRCVRQANTGAPVIILRHDNALLLIEREPFPGAGALRGS